MTFLALAYGAVWLLVGLYIAYIGTRQRKLEQEIEILDEMIAED